MSSNALRVVPVVDGVTDGNDSARSGCTCLCVSDDLIFLGRSNGCIDMYQVLAQSQPAMIPTVAFVRSVDLGTKKEISSIVSVSSDVVCISGENAYSFRSVETCAQKPNLLLKGASAVAVEERSDQFVGNPTRLAIATTKKKIVTYELSGGSGGSLTGEEISTGSDVLTRLVWFNNWIIGGSDRAYISVNPFGDRTVRDIFPVDNCVSISILRSTNEVLLVGQEGLGIFMSVQVEGLCPAPRNTVAIGQADARISVVGTYLVSVSGAEGSVEVFSLTSNEPKLIQMINLPSCGIACASLTGRSIGVPVVAGPVLYLLITVPFESQLKKLVEGGKIEEALELVNYQFSAGPVRNSALELFHNQVGWKLFHQGDFSIAFIHLTLGLQDGDIQKVVTAANGGVIETESLVNFLVNNRSTVANNSPLLRQIDRLLFELMSESDLVAFIEKYAHESATFPEDASEILAHKRLAFAKLIEVSGGDISLATTALCEGLPETAAPLIALIRLHFERIEEISIILRKLLKLNLLDDFSILLRCRDPVALLDDCSLKRPALEWLVAQGHEGSSKSALVKLFLSEERDIPALQDLVVSIGLTEIDNLSDDENSDEISLLRMLLLHNQGKDREALLRFPQLGERFIEKMNGEEKLRILFASVLFELNQHEIAVALLVKHQQGLLKTFDASRIIQIIPSDLKLTKPLIDMLKELNRAVQNKHRSSIVSENLSSFGFLSTYCEWSNYRQTQPLAVTQDSLCVICSQKLLVQQGTSSIASLPAGVAHPQCLTSTNS